MHWLRRIEFCVSKTTSTSNVRLQITSNRTPLTRNRGGGGVVITTASNPWTDRRSRARVRILARRFFEFRAPKNRLQGFTSVENRFKNHAKSIWKSIDFGIVFVAFTFGVLIFSYQKVRQLYVRIPESQIEVSKFTDRKNDQNQRKYIFYFSSLRGRGKSSAMISEVKWTHFLISSNYFQGKNASARVPLDCPSV